MSTYLEWNRARVTRAADRRRKRVEINWLLNSSDPTDRLEGMREDGCYYCGESRNDRLVKIDVSGLFCAGNTVPCCTGCERERVHLTHVALAQKYYGQRPRKHAYSSQKGPVRAY